MKKIDHYAGIPICLMLDLFHKGVSIFPSRAIKIPKKILIIKFFGVGSILLASPMIRAIRKKYPRVTVGFLTFSENREIVERLGLVDTVYTLRTDAFTSFLSDLFRLILTIRSAGYDVTIDMEFFSKFSTIVTYMSGSPLRIGYFLRQLWRGNLLTRQIYYNHYRHITEVFGALVSPLDVDVSDLSVQPPYISEQEITAAKVLLDEMGISQKDLVIGFNVNANNLSIERRWPGESFQTLANWLLRDLNVKLVFIGAASETPYVDDLVAGLFKTNRSQTPIDGRIINLAGKTTLGELIAVIKRFDILITNDSGPLHLADAMKVPTVSFFGPETPTLYGTKGENSLIFYKRLYCSPCLNVFNVKTAPCSGDNICMRAIGVEDVFNTMRENFSLIWNEYKRDD
ncbi:MAG: glycosyltransferase family 9 protein [Desulfobacterales bacterium]|nr:glycosyltransferase family 9 protein [Desulfobacterales bacterium]